MNILKKAVFPGLMIFLILLSCNSHTQEKEIAADEIIPDDAFKIEVEDGRFKLPVRINDSVVTCFALDNGMSLLLLDSSFNKNNELKLHLKFVPKTLFNMSFPSGTKRSQVSLDTLTIKTQNKTFVYKGIIVCPNMSDLFFEDQISGIMPLKLLGEREMIYIDPRLEYIRLIDSLNDNGFTAVPFNLHKTGTFIINSDICVRTKDTSLNYSGNFMIDFGFPRNEIRLNQKVTGRVDFPLIDQLELLDIDAEPSIVQTLYSDSIQFLSKFEFKNLKVTFFTPAKDESYIGIVGARLLENFIIVIDYKNNIFYIKEQQTKSENLTNESIQKLGLAITPFPRINNSNDTSSCKWIVTKISKNSKADSANIKLLDELVQIDDSPLKNYSLKLGKNAIEKSTKFTFKDANKLKLIIK